MKDEKPQKVMVLANRLRNAVLKMKQSGRHRLEVATVMVSGARKIQEIVSAVPPREYDLGGEG